LFSAILIIAILSISVSTVIGANDNTVYVSTTGNDANPGTSDSPFKTIAKAVEATPENGVVFIKAGTYTDESDNIIVINNNLTIKGEDPTTTILNGKSFQIGTKITSPTVTVQGLTFKGSGRNSLRADGLLVSINVKDSIFVDNNAIAINAGHGADINIVNSSFINNNGGYFAGAIYLDGDGNISNCNFTNNTGGQAGAIWAQQYDDGLVINKSSFSGNIATDKSIGGNDLHSVRTTWLNDCVFAPVPVGSPQSDLPSLWKQDVSGHIIVNGVSL
jgi:hypothetical protein